MKGKIVFYLVIIIVIVIGGAFVYARNFGQQYIQQPIPFDHKWHLTNVGVEECSFCHEYVQEYAVAGIPSIKVCGLCHMEGLEISDELKKEYPNAEELTAKVSDYSEKEEEIPWVRMYENPDDIVFSHKRHVSQGVKCQECHGKMGQDSRAVVNTKLISMKQCIKCHEKRKASTDCLACHK